MQKDGRADRQTRQAGRQAGRHADMSKLRVAFRSFANAPNKCGKVLYLNSEARSRKHLVLWKAISTAYSELSFVSVIQHSKSMWVYHIVIFSLSGCTIFFPHNFINRMIFGNKLLNIQYVFSFSVQLLSEIFLTVRNIQRDAIINISRSSCKVPVLLHDFK